MFENSAYPWQVTLDLAWQAFKEGSIPIGSVIVNEVQAIVAKGRNQINMIDPDNSLSGSLVSHAELNALSQLKVSEHPHIRDYHLYTSLEPCPMCLGALAMSKLRHIHYGSKDIYAGALNLVDKHKYLKNRAMNIDYVGGDIEVFQLILETSFELKRQHQRFDALLSSFKAINEDAIKLAIELDKQDYFKKAIELDVPINDLYNDLLRRYHR